MSIARPDIHSCSFSSSSDLETEIRFRALLEEFCDLTSSEGIQLTPYSEESWRKFRTFSPERRAEKCQSFASYLEVCKKAIRMGTGLRDSVALIRSALETMGLRTAPDYLSLLSDADVIEIYRSDLTQLFRNFRFLEVCSYPVADLYIYEFPELYRRPHVLTQQILKSIQDVLTSWPAKTLRCEIPDHLLEEVFSPGRHKFFIQQKIFAPILNDRDEIIGFIGSLRATPLSKNEEDAASVLNVVPLSR